MATRKKHLMATRKKNSASPGTPRRRSGNEVSAAQVNPNSAKPAPRPSPAEVDAAAFRTSHEARALGIDDGAVARSMPSASMSACSQVRHNPAQPRPDRGPGNALSD